MFPGPGGPPPAGGMFGEMPGGDIIKDEEALADEMQEIRWITAENSVFTSTPGGFASLDFEGRHYDRIAVHRAFPFTSPESFISIRESSGRIREIGMIKNLSDLAPEQQKIMQGQIRLRYFTPVIKKINDIKEEYGYSYWDVVTDRGGCRFTADNNGVAKLSRTRLIITDVDGNRFELPDVEKLPAKELRMVDLYI